MCATKVLRQVSWPARRNPSTRDLDVLPGRQTDAEPPTTTLASPPNRNPSARIIIQSRVKRQAKRRSAVLLGVFASKSCFFVEVHRGGVEDPSDHFGDEVSRLEVIRDALVLDGDLWQLSQGHVDL